MWFDDLRRDVAYSLRGLRGAPAFAATAILTIALGVGAATAILTVINTIVLRPLPYRDADRLVQLAENVTTPGPQGPRFARRFGITQDEFLEWRARATTFERMAGVINLMNGTLETPDGRVAAPAALVSPSLFEMLGVRPLLGRTLLAEDERADADAVVMSAAVWQQHFGGDPAVLGRRITLNGLPFTVVGVMPPGFAYPERSTMFWRVLAPRPGAGTRPYGNLVATLRAGASLEAATAEATALGSALRRLPSAAGYGAGSAPPTPPTTPTLGGPPRPLDLTGRPRFEVLRVQDLIVGPIRPSMPLLVLAAAVLLLIVCANLANLLLARSAARQREIGVRLALGASRGRIARQVLTESCVLAAAGGIAGIAVAMAGVQMIARLATLDTPRLFQLSLNLGDGSLLPRIGELRFDATVLAIAGIVALVTGLLVGLAPALDLFRASGVQAVVATTPWRSGAGSRPRLRAALVMAQVLMATTLLMGAALLTRSLVRLLHVDAGYDATNVLTFQLVFADGMPGERRAEVIERVIARLERDSRVASAGYTNIAPFLSVSEYGGLVVPPAATREEMLADDLRPQLRIVSHQFFTAIGARLIHGRLLTDRDDGAQPLVFVVNRALVQRYFGGRDPVGASVGVYRSPAHVEQWQIAGVIDDLAQARLDQDPFPIVKVQS